MELALDKLDEQLKPSRADKNAEKRAEQLKADLRQAVLFAGQQNAKLCVAQDRMFALSMQLYQFYSEIADGKDSNESRAHVATIMQHLRKIAEEHFEKDGTRRLKIMTFISLFLVQTPQKKCQKRQMLVIWIVRRVHRVFHR